MLTKSLYKLVSTITMLALIAFGGAAVPLGQAYALANQDTADAAQVSVSPQLFNLSMNGGVISREPWPVVSFSGLRILGDGAFWSEINTAPGVYNWSTLDSWLAAAAEHGDDVLYTFARVPQWASSNPNDINCYGIKSEGTCAPPNDVNADGTGTDQDWKNFVTALATHNQNSTTAHIKYWEMWNEPYNSFGFSGTYAQLLRMVADAHAIIKSADPNAVVLSPSLYWGTKKALTWAAGYLAAGGGQYADAIALHGYVFGFTPTGIRTDNPENLVNLLPTFKSILSTYGQGSKAIFNTEASWSVTLTWNYTDPDMQASFVARMYLLNAAYGISRLYWYEWNNSQDGTLWLQDPNNPVGPGTLLKSGVAYREIYGWMAGKYISSGCSVSGTTWSCSLSGANGYLAEAVWDTSQTCADGECTTIDRSADPKYIKYRTLSGSTVNITGTTVPVGIKPILLENQ